MEGDRLKGLGSRCWDMLIAGYYWRLTDFSVNGHSFVVYPRSVQAYQASLRVPWLFLLRSGWYLRCTLSPTYPLPS